MASVRRVPAATASAALLLTPLSAAIIAAVLLGERLAPPQILGAVLILVGIAAASGAFTGRMVRRFAHGHDDAAAAPRDADEFPPPVGQA